MGVALAFLQAFGCCQYKPFSDAAVGERVVGTVQVDGLHVS